MRKSIPKPRRKKAPKRVLALPDLEHSKAAVLNSLTSASGQHTYDHAIREFVACRAGGGCRGWHRQAGAT
jgi:hypothetical protein